MRRALITGAALTTLIGLAGCAPFEHSRRVSQSTSDTRGQRGANRRLQGLLSGLNHPDSSVRLPKGDYWIDGLVTVENASGTLRFDQGARIISANPEEGGIQFRACRALTVQGAVLEWQSPPKTRSFAGAGLMFFGGRDVLVQDAQVTGAPGAGIHFDECTRVRGDGLNAFSTAADGIHVANSGQVVLAHLITRDTGDDGCGVVNYQQKPDCSGVEVRDVSVSNSGARGIAFVGYRDCLLERFRIDRTAASGLLVCTDWFFKTRRPAEVRLRDGAIERAGLGAKPTANGVGFEVADADNVTIERVDIKSSRAGCIATNGVQGKLTIHHVNISATRLGTPAVTCQNSERIDISHLSVAGAASVGLLLKRFVQADVIDVLVGLGSDSIDAALAHFTEAGHLKARGLRTGSNQHLPVVIDDPVSGEILEARGGRTKWLNRSTRLQVTRQTME